MRLVAIAAALLAALAALATPALAATVTGSVYTHELQLARYSILSVNTTPAQRVVLVNGTYNITLPEGTYRMQAALNVDGRLFEDEINATVPDGGAYSYDFILFPSYGDPAQLPPVDQDLVFPEPAQQARPSWTPILLGAGAVILALLVASALYFGRRSVLGTSRRKPHSEAGAAVAQAPAAQAQQPLAADLQSTLAFVKAQGGRTTQRELRKHMPCSEAKLSMMLTELEAKGKIEKIKRGRGNLIVLK